MEKRIISPGDEKGSPGMTQTSELGLEIRSATETKGAVNLSKLQKSILEEQIDIPEVKSSYVGLYRYATGVDGAIMAISAS